MENQFKHLENSLEATKQALQMLLPDEHNAKQISSPGPNVRQEVGAALEQLQQVSYDINLLETNIEQYIETVNLKRQHYNQFVELIPEAYLISNGSGIIQSSNLAGTRLLGKTEKALQGKPLSIFIKREELPLFYKQLMRIRRRSIELIDNLEIQLNPTHDIPIHVSMSASTMRNPDGTVACIHWFIRDISEQIRRATEIKRLNDELQVRCQELSINREQDKDAVRLKSQFIANMSHELRTPLNGVVGMTDILLGSQLNTEQFECATVIKESAKTILSLVNDVLNLSKIDAGKLSIKNTDFDIGAMLDETLTILSVEAQKKQLSLMTYIDPRVPQLITGDKLRINQVLANLLSNAIKFTDLGEVTVKITVSADFKNIRFHVIDTGPGLSKQQIKRLFKPFSQLDSSDTREHGGAGLGLHICKTIIELMGGQIGVISDVSKGSLFWFTLPIIPNNYSCAQTPQLGTNVKRVLVLSQLAQTRYIISRLIHDSGGACVQAATIQEAECFLPECDVAIIDFNPDDQNTIDWLQNIEQHSNFHTKKVILLTLDNAPARITSDTNRKYLSKPFKASQLYGSLTQLSQTPPDNSFPTNGTDITTAVELRLHNEIPTQAHHNNLILVADDNAVNRKVIALQLKKLGFQCDVVSNGMDAVEAAASGAYSLILMDCQMPIINGFEATSLIRNNEASQGQHIPIIAFTAGALPEDQKKCLLFGMDDYLSKPVNKDALESMMSRWLSSDAEPKLGKAG